MKTFRITLVLLAVCLVPTHRTGAQTGAPIQDVEATYAFGEQFTISGLVETASDFASVDLQIAFPGDPRILSVPIEPGPDGSFAFTHLVSDRFIRAFSTVSYEFVLTATDGAVTTAGPFAFFYSDNRFDWQQLASGSLTVYWYAGDAAYARGILDAAVDGLNRSQALLGHETLSQIEIYAYASLEDYQFARGHFGQTWAGGHTDPSTGIVLVALPPGPEIRIEIERKVPHEVAHVSLFHATGAGFWNLPAWLNEGYASMLETTPNPDYQFLVAARLEAGEGIPLTDLCGAFPRDASGALLAYAQSDSVVRHIVRVYGPGGLRTLVGSYAAGASCEQGPLVAPIALDLAGLDRAWREQALAAANSRPSAAGRPDLAELAPWLAVFAAVILGPGLVLIGTGLRRGGFGGGR
ncbi:MAG TPA: peptidase MA family metallohydrolase [Anaerolineales bacterium]|nr:peptidase MA family metallohydrolase [Anaerolineales bacterium]